jgi:hypothetical protein
VFLAPAALAVFFISLYREAAGLTTAGRRKAAAALSAFFMMMATVFITSNIHGSGVLRYNSQLILARGASLALASGFLFYLIPCVAWLTFFILFTIGSAPLLKRTTSNMAALLAVVMLSRGAWSSYVLYKVLPYEYQLLDWNHPVLPILWHLVLSPAIQVFAWVSSLIFLVVVWQHRSSADSAAGSFGR